MPNMIKNILVLTQEYPADDLEKEFTPVVHFFTKEWIKLGYRVLVLNLPTNFPLIFYKGAKLVRRRLESRLGINIRTYPLSEREYELDGVKVARLPLKKNKPHGRFSKKEIIKGASKAVEFCARNSFTPDVIIGHWTNPTVDFISQLKQTYNTPCALVMHGDGYDFRNIYKNELDSIFSLIDCWGFRSYPIKREFELQFGKQQKTFMCFSGVPSKYITETEPRSFEQITNFLFVGLLLKRKHPFELVKALEKSTINNFKLDVVGEGDEASAIKQYIFENARLNDNVKLLGRVSRDEVNRLMHEADVFCMISEDEAFGLVYIEAMAAGCITIASRNEGFDGIIKDGENGFLCEAGNIEELATIFNKISNMKREDLNRISENAIKTAQQMTDEKVAESYIKDVERLLKL